MSKRTAWRWLEWLGDLWTAGPLALVGWFPFPAAAACVVAAIVWKSWAFMLFAAVIFVIGLVFRWLDGLARVSNSDPPPDQRGRRPPP